MKQKKNFFFISLARLLIVLLYVELFFHYLAFGTLWEKELITIICCTLTISPLLAAFASLLPIRWGRIFISFICWFFGFFVFLFVFLFLFFVFFVFVVLWCCVLS